MGGNDEMVIMREGKVGREYNGISTFLKWYKFIFILVVDSIFGGILCVQTNSTKLEHKK